LSIPVTEGVCAGKMQMFIRIFLRILPVATSTHSHINILPRPWSHRTADDSFLVNAD